MNGGEPSVWSVVSVSAPDLARTERGPAAVQHAEWVRLFLGRALAPARLVGQEHAPSAVEYLISGIEVSGSLHRDDAACIEAASAVATDFEGLRDVIAYHRDRIERCAQDPNNVPLELFLTTYPMLMCVTVSDDPADWRVTDQGLCIVRWGLRGPRHRPLLQWSAQELQALQRRVIAAAGLPDVAPGEASYSRVAKSAWKVIKDDDEQQRMQKVGDRAKATGGESKAASGKPAEANPSPVVARAAWMAWLETGFIVLPLTVVVLMLLFNNKWHSEAIKKVKDDAAPARVAAVAIAVEEAKAAAASALDAAVANAVTRAKRDAAAAQATAVEEAANRANEDAAAAQATAVEEAVKKAKAEAASALDAAVAKAVNKAKADAASALATAVEEAVKKAKANVANDAGMDQETRKPDSVSSQGPAKAEQSAKKPGDLDRPLDGVQSSGDENNLQSALKQLANLYKKPTNNLPDNGSSEVTDVATHLGGEAGLALQRRLQGTYVNEVQARSSGSKRAQDLHQTTATIPSGMLDVLKLQNQVFTDQNALIRIGPNPNGFEGVTCPDQKWYWVKLSDCFAVFVAASKDNPLDARQVGKVVNLQALPFKVSGFTVYRGVVGSQPKELWRWSSTGHQGFDVPQKVPPPFEIHDKGQTIEDLAEVLQAFADRVMIKDLNEVGKSESKNVPIPADVAWVCAKDVLKQFLLLTSLSDPVENGVDKDVKDWCLRLLKALEPGIDGEQPIPRFRMRDFKKLVDHPPFFLPGSQHSTLTLFGALSVSGDNAKIIKPTGGVSVRAGHLAVLDGSVLRHIGYLPKDGEPVFDAPAELESLLGCAVFVVEPKQK